MKTLGRHLELAREFGIVVPAPALRRPPARARGWSLVVGGVLTVGAFLLVEAAEQYVRERLGVSR